MEEKLGDFLSAFNRAVQLAAEHHPIARGQEQLIDQLSAHLGCEARDLPIISQEFPAARFADLDIAVASITDEDPETRLIGIGGGQHRLHLSLSDLLQDGFAPVRPAPPDFVNLPVGPGSSRKAVGLGLRLTMFEGARLVVLQRGASPQAGRPRPDLAVLAAEQPAADAFLARVDEHLRSHSILRGQVLSYAMDDFGQQGAGVSFLRRPEISAEDVILPEGVLQRLHRHVLGVADHRAGLQAHAQHLKRGVLLYGPPGTGKTHTVRHLLSASAGTTAVLLSGTSLALVGEAARLARALAPSLVVLEDIDLVAEDRSFSHGPQPLLFEVLDALDGLDADADVAFLMTTNRVDVLERALAQRPGRVDLAVEVPLPDLDSRMALMRLYAPTDVFTEAALRRAAAAMEGMTASFGRELIRRSVLAALAAGEDVADRHLDEAAAELMGQGEALTRALLGGGSAHRAAAAEESGQDPAGATQPVWAGSPAPLPPPH